MKNNLLALNNYLFEELERLNDDEIINNDTQYTKEIERAKSIQGIGSVIVNNAKLSLDAKKFLTDYGRDTTVPIMLQEDNEKEKAKK